MNSIELAMNNELESKKYYLERADRVSDSRLKTLFNTLAEDESIHLRILKSKVEGQPFELQDKYKELSAFMGGMDEIESASRTVSDPYNLYLNAMENETKSIGFYKDLIAQSKDDEEKRVFEFLLKQDEDHTKLLEKLMEMAKDLKK